jgi:hypothetical protein
MELYESMCKYNIILSCTVKHAKWYLNGFSSVLYQNCMIFRKDREYEVVL